MFKIEILCDDGRELKMQKDNYIYYKGLDGTLKDLQKEGSGAMEIHNRPHIFFPDPG